MDMDIVLDRLGEMEDDHVSSLTDAQCMQFTMYDLESSTNVAVFKKCARSLLSQEWSLIDAVKKVSFERFSNDDVLHDLLVRLENALRNVPTEKHGAVLDRALGRL